MRSYIPFLSLRYLRHHKLSSALGILGVTLGVGLVIVVVAVMDGFQVRLRRALLGSSSAIVIQPYYDLDAARLCDLLPDRVEGVLAASPVVTVPSLASRDLGGSSSQQPCQVQGIDPERESRVTDFARRLRRGEHPDAPTSLRLPATPEQPFLLTPRERISADRVRKGKQGVVVGVRLLAALDAVVGDEITLWSVRRGEGDASGDTVVGVAEKFRITGAYHSGDYVTDTTAVFMDRRDALSYFSSAFRTEATEVRVRLADEDRAEEAATRIRAAAQDLAMDSLRSGTPGLEPLAPRTWMDLNAKMLAAVQNERGLLLVITSFSFIVVAFLIGSTQSMLVVEKTREIGVLRSLGASLPGTAGVFIGNGFFIGTIGAVCGFALGSAVANNVPHIVRGIKAVTGRDLFPANIYQFSDVPIQVSPGFAATVCVCAVGFALLGAVLPALRAASLDPVASLHHE